MTALPSTSALLVICLTSRTQLFKCLSRAGALDISAHLFCTAAQRYRACLPGRRHIDGNSVLANSR